MYAKVIVNQRSHAVDRPFDYLVPPDLEDKIKPGTRVIVPFSKITSVLITLGITHYHC